ASAAATSSIKDLGNDVPDILTRPIFGPTSTNIVPTTVDPLDTEDPDRMGAVIAGETADDFAVPLAEPGLVLLVEDDFVLRTALAELLQSDGYGVECAADGLEAL